MQICQVVVATDQASINKDLGKRTHAAAGLPGLEIGIAIDGVDAMGHIHGAKQAQCSGAPGASRQNSDLKTGLGRRRCFDRLLLLIGLRVGKGLKCVGQAQEKINTFLDHGAGLEMTAPDLASPIRKTEMEVHAFRREGAIESDHLEITLQNRGLTLAGALEGCSRQIPHHAEDETGELLFDCQLLETETQITAGQASAAANASFLLKSRSHYAEKVKQSRFAMLLKR